jgi:hypothetical protein
MPLRLLVDECLTPSLVEAAIAAGHYESTCLRDRGLVGIKDWEVLAFAVANDFTLVTRNAFDFRGSGPAGPGGLYLRQPLHAGLICLDAAEGFSFEAQHLLFACALQLLHEDPDLMNQVLEVFGDVDGRIHWTRYALYGDPGPAPA